MRIIFSRKGFDSAAGGVPSPIFPDGRILSLPIPDKNSPISYKDITWNEYNVGEIVASLTNGKIPPNYRAHLDPDLNAESLPRHNEWQPIFGQVGASQGHLRNQGVTTGDLFLFFGLFQEVIANDGKFRLAPKSSPKHIIWGWFQVDTSTPVDNVDRNKFEWATYHPHFHRASNQSNTVYFAKKSLDIPGLDIENINGAGIFPYCSSKLQLTASKSRPSLWKLPLWMLPANEAASLSYHGNLERWKKEGDYVLLQTVGRGQEFVLDCSYYLDAIKWLKELPLGNNVGA